MMLVMFAAGFANLAWMAVLAAVMAYEKIGRHGRALTPVLGVALAGWGAVVLAHPSWLPPALGGL
jgi:predicted metal-binding membrane protein